MKQEHPLEKYSRIASAICCLLMSGPWYVEVFIDDFNPYEALLHAIALMSAGIWGWIGGRGAVLLMGTVAFVMSIQLPALTLATFARKLEGLGLNSEILDPGCVFSVYNLLFFGGIFVFLVSSIHGLLWVLRWVNGKLKAREQTT